MISSCTHDVAVIIGRFQPFHHGHLQLIKKAFETADNVIIFIGSSKTSRTIKNPWSFEERREMILAFMEGEYRNVQKAIVGANAYMVGTKTVHFVETRDFPYNDYQWVFNIQQKVKALYPEQLTDIALVGFKKDETTYYIDLFPQWDFVDTEHFAKNINATDIRTKIFSDDESGIEDLVPKSTYDWLIQWYVKNASIIEKLKFEYTSIQAYKNSWKVAPFPPVFVTADNVVVKSGHVLCIKRKGGLGNGLLACPGGFISQNETLQQSALRELIEETRIDLSEEELISSIKSHYVFDNPSRSLRGRTITTAYFYDLGKGELPEVKGSDDALEALWLPICELYDNEDKFFEDHFHIIKHFIGA